MVEILEIHMSSHHFLCKYIKRAKWEDENNIKGQWLGER